jgi:cytochrome c peroxidase
LVAVTIGAALAPGANLPPGAAECTRLQAGYARPQTIPFPADNPYSDAKAALGQMLFFDPRLSGLGNASCATCHNPALGWSDGLPTAIGASGKVLARRSPSLLNLAWGEPFMWDGNMPTLEAQALSPIQTDAEMNKKLPALVEELEALPAYRRMFNQVFPTEGISGPSISAAIATYERTIVSNMAPFDRWIDGDEDAISESAKRGFAVFNGKGNCAACHTGWRFTDDSFHDVGLPGNDPGRAGIVPDNPLAQNAFKTPGLRNIGQRGPYTHAGSLPTLGEVIRHYASGFIVRSSLSPEIGRLDLSAAETDDLIAFLQTLTSKDDVVPVPVLPTKDQQ